MNNLAQMSEVIYNLERRVQELEMENKELSRKRRDPIKALLLVSIAMVMTVSMAIGYLVYKELMIYNMDVPSVDYCPELGAPNGK